MSHQYKTSYINPVMLIVGCFYVQVGSTVMDSDKKQCRNCM